MTKRFRTTARAVAVLATAGLAIGLGGCASGSADGVTTLNFFQFKGEALEDFNQMIADFEEDPRLFLELWIRDSAGNYNGGEPTGMPPHTEEQINESQLRALITFLLAQTGE